SGGGGDRERDIYVADYHFAMSPTSRLSVSKSKRCPSPQFASSYYDFHVVTTWGIHRHLRKDILAENTAKHIRPGRISPEANVMHAYPSEEIVQLRHGETGKAGDEILWFGQLHGDSKLKPPPKKSSDVFLKFLER